jgi:hypothetical protein
MVAPARPRYGQRLEGPRGALRAEAFASAARRNHAAPHAVFAKGLLGRHTSVVSQKLVAVYRTQRFGRSGRER